MAEPQSGSRSQPQADRSVENSRTPKAAIGRKLSDIKLNEQLTQKQVTAKWGPPDWDRGSGVEYFSYSLEGGQELWFQFESEPPHRLLAALLVAREGPKTLLFEVNRQPAQHESK
jgi:hypothetical protein